MKQSNSHTNSETEGFYIAAFGMDGTLEGEGYWKHQDLSERWLNLCAELIDLKGQNFDHRWAGPLSKMRTKLTSAKRSGICTFFIGDRVACSMLLLRGAEALSEAHTYGMFVQSLRGSAVLNPEIAPAQLFAEVLTIAQRPLMIVVPFADPSISNQEFDLVRELSLHLASVFVRIEN